MSESRESQAILDRLVAVAELIEQHRATLYLLEHERATLQTRLRQTGWTPPAPNPQASLL